MTFEYRIAEEGKRREVRKQSVTLEEGRFLFQQWGNIIQQSGLENYTQDCSIGKLYPAIETSEGEDGKKCVKSFIEAIPKQGDVIFLIEDIRIPRLR